MQALRTEMVLTMESLGIAIEAHHHEVATGGQNEIDMRFTTLIRHPAAPHPYEFHHYYDI
jgi:glutamine synthetase